MATDSLPITGLKVVVFGFHVSFVGRFVFESFAVALLGILLSVFGLLLQE